MSHSKDYIAPPLQEQDQATTAMDIYLRAVEQAADTWGTIQKIPDYEIVVGKLLFQNIFELAPNALSMYSFGEGQEIGKCSVPEEIYEMAAFCTHARRVVGMLEAVIGMMIGNDPSLLGDALTTLGASHVEYGVLPAHYGVLETALLRTLQGGLGDVWTTEVRKGWAAVIKFVAKGMQAGAGSQIEINKDRRRDLERWKSTTLRLRVMKQSEGPSRLSRNSNISRFQSCPHRRRNSQPPRIPTRPRDDNPILPRRNSDPILATPASNGGKKVFSDYSTTETMSLEDYACITSTELSSISVLAHQ